jgi:hypothetical protein
MVLLYSRNLPMINSNRILYKDRKISSAYPPIISTNDSSIRSPTTWSKTLSKDEPSA